MPNLKADLQAAAQRKLSGSKGAMAGALTSKKYKGKYAGPDKYKGEIPEHLKGKYKGKYFGKEKYKGSNPTKAERAHTAFTEGSSDDNSKYATAWSRRSTATPRFKRRAKKLKLPTSKVATAGKVTGTGTTPTVTSVSARFTGGHPK